MSLVNIKINGLPCQTEEGTTVLQAARHLGIEIPTLCYLKDINEIGACRICVVEVVGQKNLAPACVTPVREDMEILTNSKRVFEARKQNLELILSTHNKSCLTCVRSGNCELQKMCKDFKVENGNLYEGEKIQWKIDDSAIHMIRDNNKCILCRRCVAVCNKVQAIGCIGANERGFETHIGCAYEQTLGDSSCISCGQCIVVCPTGAIVEKDNTQEIWDALDNPNKFVVVQTAPSIRVTLGEAFNMPIGTNVEGKMVAALRRIGFNKVFDTDFAADLTIMEEATEFVHRVQGGGPLPLITSCSPGWIKYCESFYPEFIPNLSSCKSPQQMFGAITKTYYAEKMGIDPKDIFVVGVMPCTAKKFEVGRADQCAAGENIPDVDVAITTRELARMIERAGLDFCNLPDEDFDSPLGLSTGAGTIFGVTGGVMEAALRTATEWVTGKELEKVEFEEVRGLQGVKTASYKVGDLNIKVAVASGLKNAKEVLERVKSGKEDYQFIEIMGCPGGCINGGGQPIQPASVRNFVNITEKRAKALYNDDEKDVIRKSHKNPDIIKLYEEYLGQPGSEKAHHILHTSYVERPIRY